MCLGDETKEMETLYVDWEGRRTWMWGGRICLGVLFVLSNVQPSQPTSIPSSLYKNPSPSLCLCLPVAGSTHVIPLACLALFLVACLHAM